MYSGVITDNMDAHRTIEGASNGVGLKLHANFPKLALNFGETNFFELQHRINTSDINTDLNKYFYFIPRLMGKTDRNRIEVKQETKTIQSVRNTQHATQTKQKNKLDPFGK